MSRGLGWIGRAISNVIEAEPDNAFTVEDLCDRVFRGANRIERKHRSSLLRALHSLAADPLGPSLLESAVRGRTLIAFNPESELSTAMAYLKGRHSNFYRARFQYRGLPRRVKTPVEEQEASLRARLAPGGSEHSCLSDPFGPGMDARIERKRRDLIRQGRDPDEEYRQERDLLAARDPSYRQWIETGEAIAQRLASSADLGGSGEPTLLDRGARTRRQFRRKKWLAEAENMRPTVISPSAD